MRPLLQPLLLLIRFNIVGLLATGAYFVSGLAIGRFTPASPLQTHLLAFLISVVVSYVGHARFTYGLSGRRYVVRFAVITALLFGASTLLTQVLARRYGVGEAWIVTAVTVSYPVFSFLLHSLWTFRRPAEERASRP